MTFGLVLSNRDALAHVALLVGDEGTLALLSVSRFTKSMLEADDDVVFLALRNALFARAENLGRCGIGGEDSTRKRKRKNQDNPSRLSRRSMVGRDTCNSIAETPRLL